ncbi:MAG TPA: winged helix-turn-helix domain-containing protein [Ktedonobacterales bacterium]
MTATTEFLRGFIRALSDPTRGAILTELEHSGELTATQLAKRLGLTANNVYHHMRVLRELKVVGEPRVVPRETYVEKYYQLAPEAQAVLGSDPEWLDRVQKGLSAEERKELFVSMCLEMAQLLQRAARRYAEMDAETFDTLIHQRKLGMLSINEMGQARLESRLKSLRDTLRHERESGIADEEPRSQQHVVLMAGLPFLWDEDEERKKEGDE